MGKIAFMFAGQGAQYPGMGRELYESSSAAKAVFDMGEAIRPGTISQCFEGTKEELTLTVNAQPCLFLCDLACAASLREAGIEADACAGFSLGEIAALAYAGIMSYEDAFRLVVLRGEAMDKCSKKQPGGMAAVLRLEPERVEKLCNNFDGMYPVNYNCPGQIACAGRADVIDEFCEAVKNAGGRSVKIAVSGAFHTPFMSDCAEKLRERLKATDISEARIPLYSNKTACPYPTDKDGIIETIASQCMSSVQWEKTLKNINADTFIELGAGTTLSGLCRKTLDGVKILNVSDEKTLQTAVMEVRDASK